MTEKTKTVEKKSKPEAIVNRKNSLSHQEDIASSSVDAHMNLCGSVGNLAVQRSFQPGYVQAKLSVGQPDDPYEKEAEQVAELVMRMPESRNSFNYIERDDQQEEKYFTIPKTRTSRYIHRAGPERNYEMTQHNNCNTPTIQRKAEGSISGTKKVSKVWRAPGSGNSLPKNIRSKIEPVLGRDLSHVKVHSSNNAAKAAMSINAKAFTYQNNIFLGKEKSVNDVHLMAHEATHVIQQSISQNKKHESFRNKLSVSHVTPQIQKDGSLWEEPPDPKKESHHKCHDRGNWSDGGHWIGHGAEPNCSDSGMNKDKVVHHNNPDEEEGLVCRQPTLEYISEPLVCQTPEPYETRIVFNWQGLQSHSGEVIQSMTAEVDMHTPVISRDDVILYAVRRDQVFDSEEDARYPVCKSRSDVFRIETVLEEEQQMSIPPMTTFGGIKWTSKGPIKVVYMTPDYAVTTDYVKFATGAAAFSLVNTADGLMLVDAGAQLPTGGVNQALAQAAVRQLLEVADGRPIVKTLLTHAHADHINILPLLAEHMELGAIRLTALQANRGVFQRTLAAIEAAQQIYRNVNLPARIRRELTTQRWIWVEQQNVAVRSSPSRLNAAWNDYVNNSIEVAQSKVRFPTIELIVGSENRPVVVEADLIRGNELIRAEVSAEFARGVRMEGALQEGQLTTFTHPEADAHARFHPDTHSANYIIQMPNGEQLVVISDIRDRDIVNLRRNFEQALRAAGQAARVRILDATHHMQRGMFTRTSAGQLVSNQFLVDAARTLGQIAAQPGGGGEAVRSAVVVGGAETRISPATVWFMRQLGYEAYVTTTASTVRMLSILEGQGQRLSGVTGQPRGGLRPSNALLLRAGLEINRAQQRVGQLDTQIESEGSSPDVVAERSRTRTQMETTRRLMHEYLNTFNREIGRGSRDPSRPAVAPAEGGAAPALAEVQALTTHLDAIGAARPSGSPMQPLSEPILVLIDRTQGMALSQRQIKIREHMRNIENLRNTSARTEALARNSRLRLMAEMAALTPLMEQEMEGLTGEDRCFVEREVTRLREGVRNLERGMRVEVQSTPDPASGGRQRTRLLVEQPIRPDWSPTRQLMEKGFGLAGRVFGSVMIYHSVSAQSDMAQRLNNDDVNALEAIAGTTHNFYGFTVGVRMVYLRPVHFGEFVILAVLDFAQTATADYDTRDQRRTALAFSGFSNALNLALFAIGGTMMKSPNPWVAGAGLIVMLLGDPILRITGAYDAFERWMSFDPGQVTGVRQELRDAMSEYQVLVGSIELAQRSEQQLKALGAQDPAALRSQACDSIAEFRNEARAKERDIISAFESGYRRARTSFSGLLGLDTLREQFAELHQRAFRDTRPTVADADMLRRFQSIEQRLYLSHASAEFIRKMEQWGDIDDKLDDIHIPLFHEKTLDINWANLNEDFREVERMLQNARYRLNPRAQGSYRVTSMLRVGSRARQVYIEQLRQREKRYSRHIARMSSHASGGTRPIQAWTPHQSFRHATFAEHETQLEPGATSKGLARDAAGNTYRVEVPQVSSAVDATSRLRENLRRYQTAVERLASRFNRQSLDKLWGESASLQRRFDALIREAGISQDLYNLEAQELALDAAANQAQLLMFLNKQASRDELQALGTEIKAVQTAVNHRKSHHGIIYRSELRKLQTRILSAEINQLAAHFARGQHPQLSDAERQALQTDELEDLGKNISSVRSQLRYAELQAMQHGRRDLHIYRMPRSCSRHGFDYKVRPGQDVVLAWTGWSISDHDLLTGGFTLLEMVPITRDAVQALCTSESRRIDSRDLNRVPVQNILRPGTRGHP